MFSCCCRRRRRRWRRTTRVNTPPSLTTTKSTSYHSSTYCIIYTNEARSLPPTNQQQQRLSRATATTKTHTPTHQHTNKTRACSSTLFSLHFRHHNYYIFVSTFFLLRFSSIKCFPLLKSTWNKYICACVYVYVYVLLWTKSFFWLLVKRFPSVCGLLFWYANTIKLISNL